MDPVTSDDVGRFVDGLVDDLQWRGQLTDPRWREALRAVPRHLFVPSVGWSVPDEPGGAGRRIDSAADPASWWDAVYSDSSIVIQADDDLKTAGYAPHLIVGDGADGHPVGAPYDRVHVTCGVADIPRAWISQTRPGGMIVAPWSPGGATGHKLRLMVVDESTAVGSFHGPATYMMLRSQRLPSVWNPHHSARPTQRQPAWTHGLSPTPAREPIWLSSPECRASAGTQCATSALRSAWL
jgi:protein-L-isoaspartate O-methyltransferase